MFKPPGITRRFTRPAEPAQMVDLVVQAIEALAPSVRPLALDLDIGCSFTDIPFLDDQASPAIREFHIRESIPPPGVTLRYVYVSPDEITNVPELTVPAIRDWCSHAVAQDPPDDQHAVVFRQLWCVFARARCFSPELTLADSAGNTWTVPLLNRGGGTWAPGPLDDRPMDAPVSFNIQNADGRLMADIQIGWDLWESPGQPEHELLEQSLAALQRLGWET